MANLQYDIYHTEIFNFLKTVTIKFEPFSGVVADSINNYVDPRINTEDVNYYYQRLLGNYIPGDTQMYVTSIDTGEKILFDKEILKDHPKTASIYRVPNEEYRLLCKRYPDQADLIKSIVYPVDSIGTLKESPDIWMVGGDTSFLQSNEVASIIDAINNFCVVCRDRWWVKEYCFEEGYPIAFYSLLWQLLPLICFTTRLTNIKTSSAHNYHIWEYLGSKGLEDYRDILSLKQSLFLYRNMEYILAHKGTTDNLFILADNILSDFSVALVGKYIYQQQQDRFDECRRTPEIISKQIVSYLKSMDPDTDTFETIETINNRMYEKSIEVNNSTTYVNKLEERYGEVEEDRLPTKLLELKKEPVSNSYEAMLVEFIVDTMIYKLSQNKLTYIVDFVDPLTNSSFKMDVQDALAMMYYFSEKSLGSTPVYVPTYGTVRIPYKEARPDKDTLPQYLWVEQNRYLISSFVDVDTLLAEVPFNDEKITSPKHFESLIFDQFSVMIKHIRDVRGSCDLCYTRSMMGLYHYLCAPGKHDITLSKYKTYEEFFGQLETYKVIKEQYEELNSKEQYDHAAGTLFNTIIPITDTRFKQYVGILDSMDKIFEKLTSLCIQLFSYNVTFLGTDRGKNEYLYMTPLAYHHIDNWGVSYGRLDSDFFAKCKGYDQTEISDVIDLPILYNGQKDYTTVPEAITAMGMETSILEYGTSIDATRCNTSIKYSFS